VSVQAYKYPVAATSVDSLGDLQDVASEDLEGAAIYQSMAPTIASVPSSNVEVTVVKVSMNPFENLEDLQTLIEDLQDQLLDEQQAQALLEEQLDATEDELNTVLDKIDEQAKQNADLRELINDLRADYEAGGDTADEAAKKAKLTALALLRGDVGVNEITNIDVTDGKLDADIILDGDVDEDSLVVFAATETGKQTIVDEQYYKVNERTARADIIQIRDYPIGDENVVQFGLYGVDGQDSVADEVVVDNPVVKGEIPEIRNIELNTLRPAVDEVVKGTVEWETAGVTLVDATVYGPSSATASVSGGELTVDGLDKSGRHVVELIGQTTDGTRYSQSVALNVREDPMDEPPMVMIIEGKLGVFTLTNTGLDGAEASIEGAKVSVTPRVTDVENTPTELHVFVGDELGAAESRLNLQLVDANEQTVRKNVRVVIHSAQTPVDAPVYRGAGAVADGTPVANGGSYGSVVSAGQGATIQTYTDSDGSLSLKVLNDPTTWQEINWSIQKVLTKYFG
jgi:hypothetical protein